jgi:hypothetical protein
VTDADHLARRGSALALAGLLALPLVVALVAVTPEAFRKALFFSGIAASAALSLAGGLSARSAVTAGTALSVRAWAGAIVGLSVSATIALFFAWSLVGAFV